MKTLLLSRPDVAELVRRAGLDHLMDQVIDGIASACRDYDANEYDVPVRNGFSYDDECVGLVEWMPLLCNGKQVSLKVVAYHPENPDQQGLPTILSTALGLDTSNGHATSIVDATFLTSIRTGAASAVASGILAPSDSRTLGLIGAGAQAVTQLHALSRVADIRSVLVADTDAGTCDNFADRIRLLDLSVSVETCTVAEITREAEIICTATSVGVGGGPVLPDGDFRAGVHINAVGSDFPGKTELPLSLLKRSMVCPDFRDQAILEGECQQLSQEDIGPDLIELVKRRDEFATWRDRPTVFDSTGWALEDHIAVSILTQLAQEHGCGQYIELETIGSDPKNPLGFLEADATLSVVSEA